MSQIASELAPKAELQPGTARSYSVRRDRRARIMSARIAGAITLTDMAIMLALILFLAAVHQVHGLLR